MKVRNTQALLDPKSSNSTCTINPGLAGHWHLYIFMTHSFNTKHKFGKNCPWTTVCYEERLAVDIHPRVWISTRFCVHYFFLMSTPRRGCPRLFITDCTRFAHFIMSAHEEAFIHQYFIIFLSELNTDQKCVMGGDV